MRRWCALVMMLAAGLARGQTTISDTYYLPQGGLFNGELRIVAPPMMCGGVSYGAQDETYTIVSGVVSVALRPNDACSVQPGQINAYRSTWKPSRGPKTDSWWLVPTSASPLTVARVTTSGAPLPQPLTFLLQTLAGSGALAGQIPQFNGTSWVPATVSGTGDMAGPSSSVDGELALYNQTTGKSLKRATQTGVARLINGVLSTVSGDAAYCVLVDGTSAPCGSGGGGAVNSVFGRAGDVTARSTDYSSFYAPISHLHAGTYEPIDTTILRSSGTFANPAWITSLAWSKLLNVPTSFTPSAHAASHAAAGADPVSPTAIGAVALSGSYANPSWITSLDILKVLPAPAGHAGHVLAVNSGATGYELVAAPAGSSATTLYTQNFAEQTSVSLTHALGTKAVVVACYDGSDRLIEASSIVTTSTSVVDVAFAAAQSGRCVVDSGGGGGASGGEGDTTTVANSGTGAAVLKSSTNVTARSVIGSSPIVVTQNTDDVTISCPTCGSGGGTVTTGSGLTGDGSSGDPVRIDPSGGAASQASYSASLTSWGTIGAASCTEKSITATGVVAGATLAEAYPSTLPAGLVGMMYAASDVVVVRLCNVTAAGVAVSDGLTFTARVISGY
jgi:hypothetical protein